MSKKEVDFIAVSERLKNDPEENESLVDAFDISEERGRELYHILKPTDLLTRFHSKTRLWAEILEIACREAKNDSEFCFIILSASWTCGKTLEMVNNPMHEILSGLMEIGK